MQVNKEKIAKLLINFAESYPQNHKERKIFTENADADNLIWSNSLAFVFGVILDQSMKAERVWEIPYLLKQRLGHLDIKKIANISDKKIVAIFNQKPKLHRFPKIMALRIKKACQLIINKYNSNPENIWNDNPRTDDLQRRFEEFDGVGQKKASMATNILVKYFGVKVKSREGIDISYDVHLRKVFLRTGLADKDDMNIMINVARKLNPEYPGILDFPCWMIGRLYCHPKNPECDKCPLADACPKLLNIELPKNV